MNLREQFEKLHPVPEGVSWSDVLDMYACEFLAYQNAEKRQNALWQGFQAGHAAGLEQQAKRITELEARQQSDAAMIDLLKQQHAIDREQLADSNEALQVMGLKLAHAEGHSANTVGGPTPVIDAAPACEPERSVSESIAAGHPCFDPDGPPDHDWEYVDDSFSHEFGTEICGHYECARCNAIKPE